MWRFWELKLALNWGWVVILCWEQEETCSATLQLLLGKHDFTILLTLVPLKCIRLCATIHVKVFRPEEVLSGRLNSAPCRFSKWQKCKWIKDHLFCYLCSLNGVEFCSRCRGNLIYQVYFFTVPALSSVNSSVKQEHESMFSFFKHPVLFFPFCFRLSTKKDMMSAKLNTLLCQTHLMWSLPGK